MARILVGALLVMIVGCDIPVHYYGHVYHGDANSEDSSIHFVKDGELFVKRTPIPGATVTLVYRGVEAAAQTDEDGAFDVHGVVSSTWNLTLKLRCEKEGFKSVNKKVRPGSRTDRLVVLLAPTE